MKKLIPLLAVLLLLPACSTAPDRTDKLLIVTSFHAMHEFTSAIAGDRAEIQTLIQAGAEPHSWEPTARDMTMLSGADLFVCSGVGMEPFARSLVDASGNDNLVWLEASKDIELLSGDPHVWLDPRNAVTQHEAICEALCALDPDNSDYYTQNMADVKARLEALHQDFSLAAAEFGTRDLVVSHAAFGYLCSAYGLNQVAISGLSSEEEPSPQQMAEAVQFISSNGIRSIFTVEHASEKVMETLSAATGASVYTLTPFESSDSDYLTAMRENLENLKEALK